MSLTTFHQEYHSPFATMKIQGGNFLCCSLEVQRPRWPWRGWSSEAGGRGWSTVEAGPPCIAPDKELAGLNNIGPDKELAGLNI